MRGFFKQALRDWDLKRSLSCDNCQVEITEEATLPTFTEMIIQENTNKKETAEIQHPVLGRRVISSKDAELNQIITKLKSTNIQFSMTSKELFGFDATTIQFYLGFLYKKALIDYKLIDKNLIEISLTTNCMMRLETK